MQSLLTYRDPKLVVSSLLHMPTDDVIAMSCDQSGSHVVEVFVGSATVPVRKKNKLIDRIKVLLVTICNSRIVAHVASFQGHFLLLCQDKHGSRVVDAVWKHCEVSKKGALASELLKHEDELTASFFGKIVLRNCNIAHYKRKQVAWQELQRAKDKKRELFRDITDSPASGRKKMEGHSKVKVEQRKVPLFEVWICQW